MNFRLTIAELPLGRLDGRVYLSSGEGELGENVERLNFILWTDFRSGGRIIMKKNEQTKKSFQKWRIFKNWAAHFRSCDLRTRRKPHCRPNGDYIMKRGADENLVSQGSATSGCGDFCLMIWTFHGVFFVVSNINLGYFG